ncbi:hypothetical protein WJX72_011694 [[Myrmecia] bisecta]|uniref:RRM domain-containing protein n=1 Tax=[Myrmecia] bisecta TaxID=41462 RepID=A0AAW1PXY9_9CHLO
MASFDDDFGDDEDFGLGDASTAAQQATNGDANIARRPSGVDDAEVDLYGDVAGGNTFQTEQGAEYDEMDDIYGSIGNTAQPQPSQQQQQQQPAQQPQQPAQASARPPPARKEQPQGTSLYVGNLQWWTTDAEIEALCSEFGLVSEVRFFEDKLTGKSKGYALVEMADVDTALQCKEGLNGRSINGKKCVVAFARTKDGAGARANGSAAGPSGGRGMGRGPAGPMAGGRGRGRGVEGDELMGMPGMGMGMPGMGMPGMGYQPPPPPRRPFGDDERDFKRMRH